MIGAARKRNRRRAGAAPSRIAALPWRQLATLAALAGLVGGAGGALVWALDQPIETVAVQGSFQRVSALDVERAVKQRVRGAGLVTVNLDTVRRAIEQLPWVDAVTVERAWPRGLRVRVTEQIAAARWGANGLLNARGELFMSEVRHIPPELPKLSGPPGSENVVAQRYLAIQGRLVEAGMRITALRLDARGSWEIDLDSGVTVRLGRRQVDERFERFVTAALQLVAQRPADIAYVDMRYANGFAVGWRGGSRATRVASATNAEDEAPDA